MEKTNNPLSPPPPLKATDGQRKASEGQEQKISEILNRGVEEIIDRESLERKLKSGKKLRVKLGIDPTSPSIHIGRAIPLLKLKDFQNLGHKVVLIIGDGTGVIGDTSDKESERPMLDAKTIKQNMKTYIQQAGKILDIKKCEVRYNSEWLGKLDYDEIGRQADNFSLNEFISRENIKKRLNAGKRVSLRELMYPLMQGYDSVAVKADVELGGTDQRGRARRGPGRAAGHARAAGRPARPVRRAVPHAVRAGGNGRRRDPVTS